MEKKDNLFRKQGGLTKLGEAKLIEKLCTEIDFEPNELKKLIVIYKKYCKGSWYMDLPTFSTFLNNSLGFTEDFFINRLFLAADTNNDCRVDLEEFIRIVAVMLRGSRKSRIKLCFTCYDLSENNELTRDDVTGLLVEAVTDSPYKEVNPDFVRDLAELTLNKLDKDHDGIISYQEFEKAALDDWLITELFGQCIPEQTHRAAFLILLETYQDNEEDAIEDEDVE